MARDESYLSPCLNELVEPGLTIIMSYYNKHGELMMNHWLIDELVDG